RVDGERHMDVAALTVKQSVGCDPDEQVQIAALPAVRSGLTLSRHANSRAVLYAGRDLYFDGLGIEPNTASSADRTGAAPDPSASLAVRTGCRLSQADSSSDTGQYLAKR